MATSKRKPRQPKITIFRNHPKIEQRIVDQLQQEAIAEIRVLDQLQLMGGKGSTTGLKRRIPELTKIEIEKALQRQKDAGNVVLGWERARLVWELV